MATKKKSGFFKKLVMAVLLVAVLAAAALAAVIHFADWNALKDKGAAYLSQTLHHKVSIGSIDASIFTGVTLTKLTIANAAGYGSQPLFYNEEAKLRLSLLSLFTGKIIISEIEFKNPALFVVKDSRGKFNFSDMASPSTSSGPAASAASGPSAAVPNVVVAAFKISGGDLTYKDLGKGTTQSVKGLDLLINGLSLKAGGNSRLELKLVAETEGKKIPVELTANFAVDLGAQTLQILSANLKVPSLSAKLSGTVTHFSGEPEIDVHAEAAAKLESLVADLAPPSALKSLPEGIKTSGQVLLDVALKGKTARPESLGFDGSLNFENVGLKYGSYPAIEAMNGKLAIGPTKASLPGLEFKMAGSPVTVKLQAKNYTVANLMGPTDKIRMAFQYEVTSPKLVLDPLLALAGSDDEKEAESAGGTAAASALAPNGGLVDYRKMVSKDLDIYGVIKVDAVQIKAIHTGKFTYTVRVLKQKFQGDTTLDLFDGQFWARTTADLTVPGPSFAFQSTLKGMQLQKFMDAAVDSFPKKKLLAQLKGKLSGDLSYSVEGKGKGLKPPATSKNLDMKGQFQLMNGRLSKLDVQEKLAAAIPHPATAAVLRKDLEFGQMLGDFSFKNEVMKLNSFEMSSGKDHRQGQVLIQANGQLRTGGAADFRVVPHFNPNVVKLDGVLQEGFADDAGWATYNYIGYAGPTLDSAKGNYFEGAKNAAKQVVQKEATKIIQDKGKDLIKQLPGGLQNLFGK